MTRSVENAFRLPWIWIALPGAVAAVVFWRTLGGGLLSDDLLLASLLDLERGGVDWRLVWGDFTGPWFGLDAPLYRPLLTLSFALDAGRGGGAAWAYHVTNLALHVGAVVATAVVAAVVAARYVAAAKAALVCGLFAAVHPIVVEPVAWIAARNSGIEVFWRQIALALFAVALARPSVRGLRAGAIVAGAAALLCKESAVVLPVCTLAIDVLVRPDADLRARLRAQAPFVLLVVAYLALRAIVLGDPLGTLGQAGVEVDPLGFAAGKLEALFVPHVAVVALWVFVLVGIVDLSALAVAAVIAWPLVLLAPTWSLGLSDDLAGSRMLLGSVHALAISLAALLFAARRPAWVAGGTLAAAATAVVMLLPTRERLAHYDEAWREVEAATHGLPEHAVDGRPLAILAMPQVRGVPPLNVNAWFPLAERPMQERDLPVVSLGFMSVEVPGSEALHGDASAARELWRWDSPLVLWDAESRRMQRLPAREGDVELALSAVSANAFRFRQPVGLLAFEVVQVECDGTIADGASVRVVTTPELPAEMTAVPLRVVDGRGYADLSHKLELLLIAAQPAFSASGIEISGVEDVTRVTVEDRVAKIEGGARLAGSVVSAGEIAARLRPPEDQRAARCVLLAPHSGIALEVDPDTRRVRVGEEVRRQLEFISRVSRGRRVYCFWESHPGTARGARSDVDWFVLGR